MVWVRLWELGNSEVVWLLLFIFSMFRYGCWLCCVCRLVVYMYLVSGLLICISGLKWVFLVCVRKFLCIS